MSDAEESMELDSLVAVENCLRCSGDSASGKLLVCSAIGCPIAIHEECVYSKPEIDEKGKFYCPYCAYKRAFLRTQKLRRKTMGAKEVLSMFIDSGGVNFPVNAGEGSSVGCANGRDGVQVENVSVGGEEDEPKEGDSEQRKVVEDGNVCGRGEGTTAGIGAVRDNRTAGKGLDGGEIENQSMEVEVSEPKEMDGNLTKGNSDQQCISEMHEFEKTNKDDGLDQRDEGSIRVSEENEGKSQGEGQIQPGTMEVPADATVVPESGDFHSGSPILRKRRFKQRAQKTVQPPYAIPLRIVSSPSTKSSPCQTDLVEEDAEKQNEKATTSSSESRKVSESNQIEKGTASSKSRDIPKSNENEKATTSSFESRKIPESNQNEKATTSSSESRQIPESNQNEKTTTSFSKTRKVPDSNQNEKTTTSTEPRKILESESEGLLLHNGKRRKINWTAEELQMLKDGVRIFTAQVNKNLPWRKILELGKDVFHETRTPDNLKDKWKNLAKEASISNKKQT